MILSILCPTIPSRQRQFELLRYKIALQCVALHTAHPTLGSVEFIPDDSKPFLEGGLSIGSKLNGLLSKAQGKYVCVLHDDDNVSPNYIETLVRLCHRNADVVTFRNITKLDTFWTTVDMSIFYPNDQASPMFEIRRTAWNICPVKTEFAKQFKYSDSNYGEDADWMTNVLTLCTTEAKTDAILHEYNHSSKHSESDKITQHEATNNIRV